ncbi:MAG TPA: IS607 family transposase [Candidatus Limnocylindrales bacterium]
MKLSEWARREGVHYQTAWRWWKSGVLPVPARQLANGTVLVDVALVPTLPGKTVAYCRVSSADQKGDLERQAGRVVTGATGRGLAVSQVVTEVGSGMNGHRRKLTRLLSDPAATVIVVEHRDRLTCFGFEHLQASLGACGRQIVVLDEAETTDDLVRDVTEVLTSLCARLYGRRSASGRAAKAVAVATSAGQA